MFSIEVHVCKPQRDSVGDTVVNVKSCQSQCPGDGNAYVAEYPKHVPWQGVSHKKEVCYTRESFIYKKKPYLLRNLSMTLRAKYN